MSEARSFAGFVAGLPAFLNQRITLDDARRVIHRRMADRAANLLQTLEHAVFTNPRNPYARMLHLARCEPGDVRGLIEREGVEAALVALRAAGVGLTFEEFKGTGPIVRQGEVIEAGPTAFDNPGSGRSYPLMTGGSTGPGRRIAMDLEHMRARLPMQIVADAVHGVLGLPTAIWFEIPPGNGLNSLLMRVPYDNVPERWYTPLWAGPTGAPLRFRLATRTVLARARLAGVKLPDPVHLPLERADVIACWAADTLRTRQRCAIRGHVSKMLRVALAARERGLDLSGAVIMAGGEPPTPAKVRQIEATGARFVTNYHLTEAGPVGMRCATSTDANDQHVLMDHLALIPAPRELPRFGIGVDAFCLTTLLPTAPRFLLNVEIDDCGVIEHRACGCPWESFGFTTHVRDIRSYRKLTGEGVTLVGTDMERILEDVLPARFGGGPLDYQLLEEEDERGFTRLSLLVSPGIGIDDEDAVIETVLRALSRGDAGAAMSGAIWRQAGALRIRREPPRSTARGKVLPLHVERAGTGQPGPRAVGDGK